MILLKDPQGRRTAGTLSTTHAASSYGLPVLVLQDGTALGPGDVALQGYRVMTATQREQDLLRIAGYRLDA